MTEENIIGGRRTEPQHATYGASHDRKTNMEDTSQMRGHAEMPSTVAERPASREKEQMKFRVNNQGLYPCSAWLG